MSKYQRKPRTNVFHIRIGNQMEKIDIKDPFFLKLLEQQYATKYLQSLGVEATQKAINKILKQNPIQNCQIIQSRLNGGLYTDTITIITKSASQSAQNKKNQKQSVSNQMLQMLDLKRMNQKKTIQRIKVNQIQSTQVANKEKQNNNEGLKFLSFQIEDIKQRYIFPFNDNFKRKNNYRMKDTSNLLDSEDSKIIYQSKIFHFPFTQVKLSLKTLKELQNPIQAKFTDISKFLDQFYQNFPTQLFPVIPQSKVANVIPSMNFTSTGIQSTNFNIKTTQKNNSQTKQMSDIEKYSSVFFTKKNIDFMFQIIRSQNNAKFIGVFLHFAYWTIFGGVNPIQIQASMKKKMYIMMFQTIQYFQIKVQNKKIWMTLVFPMVLLTLKMASHYFFQLQYPKLLQNQQSKKLGIYDLTIDKILFLVEKIFDQGNINGRFIFLESDISGPKGNFLKDKQFIRKRIFGTSPALQIILPNPKNGKTRLIMAKNNQIDKQSGISQQKSNINAKDKKNIEIEKEDQEKLLCLALHKINNRLQQIQGHSTQINPILKLKL